MKWITKWKQDQQEQGDDWEFNGDLGKGLVGLIIDFIDSFGNSHMQVYFNQMMPYIDWLFKECKKWELNNDTNNVNDTFVANVMRKMRSNT